MLLLLYSLLMDLLLVGFLVLVGFFCLEVLMAIIPWPENTRVEPLSRLRFAVLIPVHNEGPALARTLQSVMPTLGPKDRVLVVADSCTDNTALVARQAGAEVVQRHDPSNTGRAHAIDFGINHLASDPPEAVVILDPGCRVESDTVRLLGTAAVTMRRPAHGMDFADLEDDGDPRRTMERLGHRFRGLVRAIGLWRLAGFCYTSGTGMALPWSLTSILRVNDENFAEGRQLGLNLAAEGYPPLLITYAPVNSPPRRQGTSPPGYFSTLTKEVPRMASNALQNCRPDLIAVALDLAVPPPRTFVRLWLLTILAAVVVIPFGGSAWPATLAFLSGIWTLGFVAAAWMVYCSKQIPLSSLIVVLVAKLPFLAPLFRKRRQEYVA